ncbi:glutaredoxin [Erysipelothrix amsterdamensis]|uniref:Glutaredoxin n=1 Tax=Erysipelothrix amsterdamensis TaxID=2929157 RepID=A0AAU9VHK2_9FIRM|nr:glutaredoxin [Erysipelothrix sp. A18Y020d]CAH2761380.1 glutaredoxin [Erysipelothrix sp. A18Y020d]
MTKIMMLTQDNCPKCMALKNFLELGLRNKYAEHIEVVKREDDPERFKSIALEHGVMATPVLIAGGEVLVDTNPSKVNAFFEKII